MTDQPKQWTARTPGTPTDELAAKILTALDNGEFDRARAILEGFAIPVETRTEYRNEDGETTLDESVAHGWTDAGLEVDARTGEDEFAPWNYEAGFDYERNRYADGTTP